VIRRLAVGKPSVLIPHLLKRQFTATKPNAVWVADISYIRTGYRVRERSVASIVPFASSRTEYESEGHLLGQCRRGFVL
jgi:transposase InsO family protein